MKTHTYSKIFFTGYTLLELMLVLSLLSILSLISFGTASNYIEEQRLKHDTKLLLHTLESAKTMALISHHEVQVRFDQQRLMLIADGDQTEFVLSAKNTLDFAHFPRGETDTIAFTAEGRTQFQNGTFTLTSPRGKQRQLVINQGGRVYERELSNAAAAAYDI